MKEVVMVLRLVEKFVEKRLSITYKFVLVTLLIYHTYEYILSPIIWNR